VRLQLFAAKFSRPGAERVPNPVQEVRGSSSIVCDTNANDDGSLDFTPLLRKALPAQPARGDAHAVAHVWTALRTGEGRSRKTGERETQQAAGGGGSHEGSAILVMLCVKRVAEQP